MASPFPSFLLLIKTICTASFSLSSPLSFPFPSWYGRSGPHGILTGREGWRMEVLWRCILCPDTPWCVQVHRVLEGGGRGGSKRYSWCDSESGYIKQIRKCIEQLGAYIENNESQVGEQSCKCGEGMIYRKPWRWIGIWRCKYQFTLF